MSARVNAVFSSIAAVQPFVMSARNVQSQFKSANNTSGGPEQQSDVLVLQFGSRHVRIGHCKDALPRCFEQVIRYEKAAVAVDSTAGSLDTDLPALADMSADEVSLRITGLYRDRGLKRPGGNYAVHAANFNRTADVFTIPIHNDTASVEWTELNASGKFPSFVVGKDALLLDPQGDGLKFEEARRPIQRGRFHLDHRGVVGVEDDLVRIWNYCLETMEIRKESRRQQGLVVVFPQTMDAMECQALVRVIFALGFSWGTLLPLSVSATFGAGVSSALVVDVGAQCTVVSVVEEGQAVAVQFADMGGDDLTMALLPILSARSFQYAEECDPISSYLDFCMLEELKQATSTLIETDVLGNMSPLLAEAHVRRPNIPTRVFPIKMLEERMLLPSLLFETDSILLNTTLWPRQAVAASVMMMDDGGLLADESEAGVEQANDDGGNAAGEVDKKQIEAVRCAFVLGKGKRCNVMLESMDAMFDHVYAEHCSVSEDFGCGWCDATLSPLLTISNDVAMEVDSVNDGVESSNQEKQTEKTAGVCMGEEEMLTRSHIANHVMQRMSKDQSMDVEVTNNTLLLGLDDLLVNQLAKLDSESLARVCSSILLVGGTTRIAGFASQVASVVHGFLADRQEKEEMADVQVDFVIGGSKDTGKLLLDGASIAWKGGAVFARLECTASDGWISRQQFERSGVKALRDAVIYNI